MLPLRGGPVSFLLPFLHFSFLSTSLFCGVLRKRERGALRGPDKGLVSAPRGKPPDRWTLSRAPSGYLPPGTCAGLLFARASGAPARPRKLPLSKSRNYGTLIGRNEAALKRPHRER